jgi:hypothetical protein
MSRSYAIYHVHRFPDVSLGSTLAIPQQKAFELVREDPPRTELTSLRRIDPLDTTVYRVFHEFYVRQPGRAQGVEFAYYIGQSRFAMFHCESRSLLLLRTKKRVALSAMKALTEKKTVEATRRKINVNAILDLINDPSGAWFRVQNNTHVRSIALFGYAVDKDQRFDKALEEGDIYYLRFTHEFESVLYPVGITEYGNVGVFADDLEEQEELALVLDVKARLIDATQDGA